jgi:SH3-like domain-containing protein
VKAGTPVEIVQEFDTWRKIRDVDGSEGWVHQNLLAGERAGLVTPWNTDGQVALRDRGDEDANILAWLGPNFPVTIDSCDGTWCAVKATDHPPGGNPSTYSGFVMQADLWGVYSGETFD